MARFVIILLAAILIIGGGAWFVLQKSDRGSASSDMAATSTAPSSETFASKSSLKDLVAKGGSWKCSFAINAGGADSTGTVYVAMGKVRSDFTSVVQRANMTIQSHMISDGAYAYSWTSAMPQGFKVAINTNAAASAPATSGNPGFDYNSPLDYNCVAWPADESMFTLPANITFTIVKG